MKFSTKVIEKLGFYVYCLVRPDTGKVFYVGKGRNNRIFQHAIHAKKEKNASSEKIDLIKRIHNSGKQVRYYILRHGMDSVTAFEVEAAMIDYLGFDNQNLHNQIRGQNIIRGKASVKQLEITYAAEKVGKITEPSIILNIRNAFSYEMSDEEVYKACEKAWILSNRRKNVKYVLAVAQGIVRGVYKINSWYKVKVKSKVRWGFRRNLQISKEIVDKYSDKNVEKFLKSKKTGNPIQAPTIYLNC